MSKTEDDLNKIMADFGFSEKISIESEFPAISLESSRKLTQKEVDLIIVSVNMDLGKKNSTFECTKVELVK